MTATLLDRPATRMGRQDPITTLAQRPRYDARSTRAMLDELRRDIDWDVPVERNAREVISQRAKGHLRRKLRPVTKFAIKLVPTVRNAPPTATDIPTMWIGTGAPATFLVDTPENVHRNSVWNLLINYGRLAMSMETKLQKIAAIRARQKAIAEFIDTHCDNDAMEDCAVVGVWADYVECFGSLPTPREREIAAQKRLEASYEALKLPALAGMA